MLGTICRRFCSSTRVFNQQKNSLLHRHTNKVTHGFPRCNTLQPFRHIQQQQKQQNQGRQYGLLEQLFTNPKVLLVACGGVAAPLIGYMWGSIEDTPYTGRKRMLGRLKMSGWMLTYLDWTQWLLHRENTNLEILPTDDPLYTRVATAINKLCNSNDLAAISTKFSLYTDPKDTTTACSSPGRLNFNASALRDASDEELQRVVARNLAHVVLEHRNEQALTFIFFTLIGLIFSWPLIIKLPKLPGSAAGTVSRINGGTSGGAKGPPPSATKHYVSVLIPITTYLYFTKVYWKILDKEAGTVGDIFCEVVRELDQDGGGSVESIDMADSWKTDSKEYSF